MSAGVWICITRGEEATRSGRVSPPEVNASATAALRFDYAFGRMMYSANFIRSGHTPEVRTSLTGDATRRVGLARVNAPGRLLYAPIWTADIHKFRDRWRDSFRERVISRNGD